MKLDEIGIKKGSIVFLNPDDGLGIIQQIETLPDGDVATVWYCPLLNESGLMYHNNAKYPLREWSARRKQGELLVRQAKKHLIKEINSYKLILPKLS